MNVLSPPTTTDRGYTSPLFTNFFSSARSNLRASGAKIAVIALATSAFNFSAEAEITLYETDFGSTNPVDSLTGQEFWVSSDPDIGLGTGSTDGIASIAGIQGRSNAGFLGGFYRDRFLPGQSEIFLGPLFEPVGDSVIFNTDFVLVGSQSTGAFAADDSFGWSLRTATGSEVFRIIFEPSENGDDRRLISAVDMNGIRGDSGFDLFVGSSYALEIEVSAEAGGDRVVASIDGQALDFGFSLLPSGSGQSVAQIAAVWTIANPTTDPITGAVTGFGNNIIAFDNYVVTSDTQGVVYATNLSVAEEAGNATLTVEVCDAPVGDLEIFYTTS